jgi:uncharacterized membrane protein YqjE
MTHYRAIVQRLEKFFPLLLVAVIASGFGIRWSSSIASYHESNAAMMKVVAGLLLTVFWAFANTYRVHVWVLDPDGIQIRERPRVPLTGLRRRAVVTYEDILALQASGSGAKRSLRMTVRDGHQFIMDQAVSKHPQFRFLVADPDADILELEREIRDRAAQSGNLLPGTSQGLSYFQTIGGLTVAGILFLLALPVTVLTVWAVWDGARPTSTNKTTIDAALLFLILPVIFGWLFVKSLRGRRRIMKNHAPRVRQAASQE